MKAVNITKYRFKTIHGGTYSFIRGFGIINKDGEFASLDGKRPYVIDTKKWMNEIIYGIENLGTPWNFKWIAPIQA